MLNNNISSKKFLYMIILITLFLIAYFFFNADKKQYIMEGTVYETPVYYINNNQRMKVMIIGGIHGNEIGGIIAADDIVDNEYDWADFIIIPRANIEAFKQNVRAPYYMSDLNRAFPGKLLATDTEELAFGLYSFIQDVNPDLVIDLHEWRRKYDGDGSTNSNGLIVSSGDMKFFKAIENVYADCIGANSDYKVMLEFGGISGTLNREVSEGLGIPALTIESNMNTDI